jgi:hypothetical protein
MSGSIRATTKFVIRPNSKRCLQKYAGIPPANRAQPSCLHNPEQGLFSEGITYGRDRFYLGSTAKHKIIERTPTGACRDFAKEGLGEVLGLKVHKGTLWAASNADLFHYDPSGTLMRKYTGGRLFNDPGELCVFA